MQAIEDMIEEAKASYLPPVMSAYTSLIKAWGRRKSLVNVRRVLVDMVEDRVQPNQLHFCAAIVAHGQSQRPAESEVFTKLMSCCCYVGLCCWAGLSLPSLVCTQCLVSWCMSCILSCLCHQDTCQLEIFAGIRMAVLTLHLCQAKT